MSHGYEPAWSEGALKSPVFQTSTFVFKTAEEGKRFFEVAYRLREKGPDETEGLIYSRLNNPNVEILENRLCLWDGAESCAVFDSGMSAISTILLAYLSPGDLLIHSNPLYGGTDRFMKQVLRRFGIEVAGFDPWDDRATITSKIQAAGADRLKMIYVETPANPTNHLIDIASAVEIAAELSTPHRRVLVVVDNTYMGPIWQNPLKLGADLILYSATKYIGGHSDVIAGACMGAADVIAPVRSLRSYLGGMASPWTAWMLMRSLETLKVRMDRHALNAQLVADFLRDHSKIKRVYYPGHLTETDGRQYEIFKSQCHTGGAMLAFDIVGGEAEAFRFLNALSLIYLAVSLGSTESLAQHPATMTHADIDPVLKQTMGISDSMIRLSVGIEHPDDLITDLQQALDQV